MLEDKVSKLQEALDYFKEFERLKRNETYQEKIEWHANRLLSKLNYVVHTDAIKNI